MIGIYKITNPIGQVYIGQSKRLEVRKQEHLTSKVKSHFRLNESIKKYGIENHVFEIIEECKKHKLNERERFWQEHYDVLKNGLNCELVGTKKMPKVLCQESADRIKKALTGRKQAESHLKKRSESKTKPIIDINTGVFYDNVEQVSKLYDINRSTLVSWLNTLKRNKSPFRYALEDRIQNDY